ncbi:MAG: bifunctional 3,4-dihydroxy-2-butanone 4-phosphate synthase/GTP cyclohydrolase II [Helicobacteraceae bacterium]|jgi:3,4-dihydroxy 2-butanone 4-phosphate synthase/GTP cyclohydrolase II|nr:bifunctional 3,4-dihydroxy-2-butanone 4-phosphate synthase/GTP cyclohydrolase II [Helicobacteraceae bacterium]
MSVEARVERAAEAIRSGGMAIMIDDEERENEGDLIYAGTFSTPEMVNFMIKEARGLVCISLNQADATRLELSPMVTDNQSGHGTAFTVTVDAKSAVTGISAFERNDAIRIIADPLSKPSDLVRPGHIFPLIAKEGGVLARTGHTEGSLDLCRIAGVSQCAVICEVVRPDGAMARRDYLDEFAKRHNMPLIFVADLVEYRLKRERLVQKSRAEICRLFDTEVEISYWTDHQSRVHRAVKFGSFGDSCAAKFHRIGIDADLILCDNQLGGILRAIEYLKKAGGILLFIDGGGGDPKKEFGIGAQIISSFGVKKLTLLATKEIDAPVALGGFGIELMETELFV